MYPTLGISSLHLIRVDFRKLIVIMFVETRTDANHEIKLPNGLGPVMILCPNEYAML